MQIAATTVEKSAQDIRKKYTSGTCKIQNDTFKTTNVKIRFAICEHQLAIQRSVQDITKKLTSDIAKTKLELTHKKYTIKKYTM